MTTRSILPAALSLCLLASPMAAEELTDMAAGARVSNFVTMGKNQIPLPKGEWELKVIATKRHQDRGLLGRALLMQETSESGFVAISLFSNIDSCTAYRGPKILCDRKNTHHNESDGGAGSNNAKCWDVSHLSFDPNYRVKKGFWKKHFNERNELLKTVFPKMITFLVNHFWWSNQCRSVRMTYAASPENFGFKPESSKWTDSAWHRNIVGKDPRRAEFVAAVTNAGRELKDAVKSGFDGKLDGWTSDIALKFE